MLKSLYFSVDRNKYAIQIPLPPKIDPTVTLMTVEEKPDVTYKDVGGCKEQIEKLREVVELPLLHVSSTHNNNFIYFCSLNVSLDWVSTLLKVFCYMDHLVGSFLLSSDHSGTGKTLLARAVANRTDAVFIRVIGSELVQKFVMRGTSVFYKHKICW